MVRRGGWCPTTSRPASIRPDLYDPKINRSFGEFAAHYGCLVDPARLAKPRDKATVERHVPYARDSFFAGRAGEFADLAAMQADALRWCRQVANARQCRPLERVAPQVVFDAEEREALLPLPRQSFELARWSTPKVGPDIHVKVGKALYSVPWAHIGRTVDAREGVRTVEVFLEGTLIKTHVRVERGKQTDNGDYPPEKIAFFMHTPAWCRRKAAELGVSVAEVVAVIMEVNALYRLRQAQGVVGLADKHGAERLEAACRRAIDVGDPSYKTVKGILAAGTEHEGDERPDAPPSAPAHLHGPGASLRWGGGPMRTHQLEDALRALKLFGMLDTLEARLAQATAGELGHVELLGVLCADEATRRDAAGLERRLKAARFEQSATIEEFDFSFNPKIPAPVIRDLATLRFVDAGESVILHGPVGVGKSMIAQALGHAACRRGHSVVFTKTSRLLADLAGGHADRSWEARLRRWARPTVLILDDFAIRDFTLAQADDLYELVTERGARPAIFTANRQASDWYSLFPNPVVAESILDRIVNSAHHVHMDGRSFRPNKRPGATQPGRPSDGGPTCASAGCDNAVIRRPGRRGRPPIYCSPACRPSRTGGAGRNQISVEVDQQDRRRRARPELGGDAATRAAPGGRRPGPRALQRHRPVRRAAHAPAPSFPTGRRRHRVDISLTPGEGIP